MRRRWKAVRPSSKRPRSNCGQSARMRFIRRFSTISRLALMVSASALAWAYGSGNNIFMSGSRWVRYVKSDGTEFRIVFPECRKVKPVVCGLKIHGAFGACILPFRVWHLTLHQVVDVSPGLVPGNKIWGGVAVRLDLTDEDPRIPAFVEWFSLRMAIVAAAGMARGEQVMKVPLLDLKPQYAGIREEVRQALDAVCDDEGCAVHHQHF